MQAQLQADDSWLDICYPPLGISQDLSAVLVGLFEDLSNDPSSYLYRERQRQQQQQTPGNLPSQPNLQAAPQHRAPSAAQVTPQPLGAPSGQAATPAAQQPVSLASGPSTHVHVSTGDRPTPGQAATPAPSTLSTEEYAAASKQPLPAAAVTGQQQQQPLPPPAAGRPAADIPAATAAAAATVRPVAAKASPLGKRLRRGRVLAASDESDVEDREEHAAAEALSSPSQQAAMQTEYAGGRIAAGEPSVGEEAQGSEEQDEETVTEQSDTQSEEEVKVGAPCVVT